MEPADQRRQVHAAGRRVRSSLERVDSHVEIVVQDTGIGIRPEFLPFVFDRFRQADASTTRRYGGLGLGLAIVSNLVELHGGSVRVKSAGENRGSRFVVALSPPRTSVPRKPARYNRPPPLGYPLGCGSSFHGLDGVASPRLSMMSRTAGRWLLASCRSGARERLAQAARTRLSAFCNSTLSTFF